MPILSHIFKKSRRQPKAPKKAKQKKQEERQQPKQQQQKAKRKQSKKTSKASSPIKTEKAHGAYNIVIRPHISEKSVAKNNIGKYVFDVYRGAGKSEIAKAVEALYNVEVAKVHKINLPPKSRRYRRDISKQQRPAKAIVTLKKGHEIEVLPH